MSQASQLIIRFALCILFFWFGIQQLIHPTSWVAFLPTWTGYFPITGELLVRLNGWFEVVFAALLGIGFYTRPVALLLGLHLLGIAWTAGGAIGVRDAVLAACAIAFVFSPADAWTMDKRYFK